MTGIDVEALVSRAETLSRSQNSAEMAVHGVVRTFFDGLGDRSAHLKAGALGPGQSQFFVGGAFMVTPDRTSLMLIGNIGFPEEQRRLLVPIDGGNPGQVIASGQPLLLKDTTTRPDFKQYLSTSRMGSAIYAPLRQGDETFGLIIMAAQARWTFGEDDLAALVALAPLAESAWTSHAGAAWLAEDYNHQRGGTLRKA